MKLYHYIGRTLTLQLAPLEGGATEGGTLGSAQPRAHTRAVVGGGS
jgi:hypothetical protein